MISTHEVVKWVDTRTVLSFPISIYDIQIEEEQKKFKETRFFGHFYFFQMVFRGGGGRGR